MIVEISIISPEAYPTNTNFGSNIIASPTLNTDPQNNVWKDGDGQYISPSKGNSLTYYECKWLGGDINGNSLPIQDQNKYSTIPCTYKANYTQLNKFICNDDPNKTGITKNCSKF